VVLLPSKRQDTGTDEWVLNMLSWSKEGTVRHCQSKEASILWSYHEDTRELPGERNNARNNARCMQARKLSCGQTGKQTDATENIHLASLCYAGGGKTVFICIRCYMIILLKGATKKRANERHELKKMPLFSCW